MNSTVEKNSADISSNSTLIQKQQKDFESKLKNIEVLVSKIRENPPIQPQKPQIGGQTPPPELLNQIRTLSVNSDQLIYNVDKMKYDIDMVKDDVNRYRRNQGDFLARVDQVERKLDNFVTRTSTGNLSNVSQNFMNNMSGMTMVGLNSTDDRYLHKLKGDYGSQPLQKISEENQYKNKPVTGFASGAGKNDEPDMFGDLSVINKEGIFLCKIR